MSYCQGCADRERELVKLRERIEALALEIRRSGASVNSIFIGRQWAESSVRALLTGGTDNG